MGTRHLTCVIQDGAFRIAQYGQWDGYPSGAGRTILSFLNRVDMSVFRDKVRACRWMDKEKFDARYKALGLPENGWLTSAQSEVYKREFPLLDRDLGCGVLEEVYASEDGCELNDDSAFAHSSLFCEWAYVIDLDRNILEVYRGFNTDLKAPVGAFARVPKGAQSDEYGTVRLVRSYPLADLPSWETLDEDCSSSGDW